MIADTYFRPQLLKPKTFHARFLVNEGDGKFVLTFDIFLSLILKFF
jgi:hypothetical protein